MDLNEFENLLGELSNPDNAIRQQAEEKLGKCDVTTRSLGFLQLLSQPERNKQERIMAAVLFRKLIRTQDDLLEILTASNHIAGVQSQLLRCMLGEQERDLRLKIADCVAALAELFVSASADDFGGATQWHELLVMMRDVNQTDVAQQESCLRVLSSFPIIFGAEIGQDSVVAVGQRLFNSLSSHDINVKGAACLALGSFLHNYGEEKSVTQNLKDLVKPYLMVLTQLVESNYMDVSSVLSSFVEVCESAADFLRPFLRETMHLLYTIASNEEIDESCRHMAVEAFVSLCESIPAAVRKHGRADFIGEFTQLMLKMMTDLEYADDWPYLDDSDCDEDEQSNAVTGETSLDRMACALSGNIMLPYIKSLVPQMMKSDNWQYRYAGLMAVGACGEGCHKQMEQILGAIIDSIVPLCEDPHPRVRYAVSNSLGQMCSDFAPTIQRNHHAKIMHALTCLMEKSDWPRVQGHACAALVNFSENCPKNILNSYLDQLMHKLVEIMRLRFEGLQQHGEKLVLQQVVTTIAGLADGVESDFTPHYDSVMPLMKYIIENAVQPELRVLRGKAIECISIIALAVGKEKFLPDSKMLMDLLLQVQSTLDTASEMPADDPQLSYMISAWARICRLLGPQFEPYLPHVMGPLMRVARMEPEYLLCDSDDGDDDVPDGSAWTTVKLNDNQNFSINTTLLEDKATAITLLVCYAKEIKAGFLPYLQPVAQLMTKSLNFYFNDEIRSSAAESLSHLLQIAGFHSDETRLELWATFKPALLCAFSSEPESEVKGDMFLALSQCITVMERQSFTVEDMNTLGCHLVNVFEKHFKNHETRVKQRQDEDYDEEEENRLMSEKDDDEYVLSKVCDVMRALFKTHGIELIPFFKQLEPFVFRLLEQSQPWSDFSWGLCFLDDLLEHVPMADSQCYHELFCTNIERGMNHQEPDVRQSAFYGVGVAAIHCSKAPEFVTWLLKVAPILILHIRRAMGAEAGDTGAQGDGRVGNIPDELGFCTENAISAFTKIMKYCPAGIPEQIRNASLISRWLNWLPLRHDEEEVPHVYAYLCDLLEANHPELTQDPNALAYVVYCFACSLQRGVFKADMNPLFNRCMTIVRHIQMNPATLSAALQLMDNDEKKALERAVNMIAT